MVAKRDLPPRESRYDVCPTLELALVFSPNTRSTCLDGATVCPQACGRQNSRSRTNGNKNRCTLLMLCLLMSFWKTNREPCRQAWLGRLARKTSNGSDVQANARSELLNTKSNRVVAARKQRG